MAVDLGNVIDLASLSADDSAMLEDLQGNILDGHGRKSTIHLFLEFGDQAAARAFVQALADKVTKASQQFADAAVFRETGKSGDPFVGVLLSAKGYEALGIAALPRPDHANDTPFGPFGADDAFEQGMGARAALLGDDPAKVESDYQKRIDAMILIGGNPDFATSWTSTEATAKEAEITALMGSAATVVAREVGRAIHRWAPAMTADTEVKLEGIEHFGYVDGRSQPLMIQSLLDRESDESDGISVWDPRFPIGQVLVKDPASSSANAFGSFFVFRKLEQDVAGFKDAEEALGAATGLGEVAGAMLVGRFEDGTPVVLQREDGGDNPVLNNFNYAGDPDGLRCPHFAHIRKTNPRADDVAERRHIMARRGMTYGRRDAVNNPSDRPSGGVGLMFMSFQNNLTQQFEFTQSAWANNVDFEHPNTGRDPVIGQVGTLDANPPPPEVDLAVPEHWGRRGSSHRSAAFDLHVTFRGGEYFFAPAISTLASLDPAAAAAA